MAESQCVCRLLLVEDNEDEAFLFQSALAKVNLAASSFHCHSLPEAKSYLEGNGKFADRSKFPFPELVISDLKLGVESGFDFLRWIRAHETLRPIPVVLMSGSRVPNAVREAYALGANAIITKPVNHDEMIKYLDAIVEFWCGVAESPAISH